MANVLISLLADTTRATKSIDSFVSGTTKVITGLAAAFGAAFAFNKIVTAAAESEDAINKMNVALKLSGDFTVEAADRFEALASELEKTTIFNDELVLSSLALAKTFDVTNEEAENLVKAATDLAAITGSDLTSATQLLGRSLDGTAGKLNEILPGIRNFSAEQLRAGAAVDFVAQRLNGAAATLANSFTGKLTKAINQFDNLLETLGAFVIKNKFVLDGLDKLQGVLINLNTSLIKNKDAFLGLVKDGILVFLKSLDLVLDAIKAIDVGFQKIRQFGKTVLGQFTQQYKTQQKENDEIEESLLRRKTVYNTLIGSVEDFTKKLEETSARQVEASKKASDGLENQQKAVKQLSDEQLKSIQSNPFAGSDGLLGLSSGPSKPLGNDLSKGAAIGTSLSGSALQGEAGAIKIAGQIASAIGTAFLGPIGQALGPIFEILAQGPEKVRELLTSFLEAIPTIIENIILSIPVILEVIAEKLPEILIEGIPKIVEALARSMPQVSLALAVSMPLAAVRFAVELIKNIPKMIGTFISELIKGAGRFIQELISQVTGGIGGEKGFLGSGLLSNDGVLGIKGVPFLAEGGQVPAGFPNDSFPAFLSSGENVISRGLNEKLDAFLNRAPTSGGGGMTTVVVQVGEKELARTLFNLNNQGFRTS